MNDDTSTEIKEVIQIHFDIAETLNKFLVYIVLNLKISPWKTSETYAD